MQLTGWKAPSVASFSNSGSSSRHVDLLAPGKSITALRNPGSFVDAEHPEGLVAGDTSGRLFRGSGTSQAAAVVSGAAALLVQANPQLTPDQVKAAMTTTAVPVRGVAPESQGAGQIELKGALVAARLANTIRVGGVTTRQSFPEATGLGSLEAARGGTGVSDPDGVTVYGEIDAQGQPFDAARWSTASAAGQAWSAGVWNDEQWTGDGWSGGRWSDANWQSARWSSARWSSARWSSARWSSARWSSARWSSARWSASDWS